MSDAVAMTVDEALRYADSIPDIGRGAVSKVLAAEASPEYTRERFRQSMAVRYRRKVWRQFVIKELKTRRLNNLRRNTKRCYTMWPKWGFER